MKKPNKLKIELTDFHHRCGDGCCDTYGIDVKVNGVELDTYAYNEENALEMVLEHLGYKVEIERGDSYEN